MIIGKKIGLTVGTQFEYFLDQLLIYYKITRDQVEIVDSNVADLGDLLKKGEIDIALSVSSIVNQLITDPINQIKILPVDQFLESNMVLVTTNSFLTNNKRQVNGFFRAIDNSIKDINNLDDETITILKELTGLSEEDLTVLYNSIYFQLSMDKSLLLTINNQTKWMIKQHYQDIVEFPDFSNHINSNILRSLDSGYVTVDVEQ